MRKSKSFTAIFALAVLFLLASATYALTTGTFASASYASDENTGYAGGYAEGKVVLFRDFWCVIAQNKPSFKFG